MGAAPLQALHNATSMVRCHKPAFARPFLVNLVIALFYFSPLLPACVTSRRLCVAQVGIGLAPEGIFQNFPVYELLIEMAWRSEVVEPSSWLQQYVRRRYGPNAPQAVYDAWEVMLSTLYSTMDQQFGSMYSSR